MLGNLINAFAKIGEKEEKRENEIFMKGKAVGIEEGIIIGMSKNFERSQELSDEEYAEVMEFLISRNLELCCYDMMRGGFRIRKHIHTNPIVNQPKTLD